MAVTLFEASKNHKGDVVRSAVIEMFAQQSPILNAFPWENIPGGVLKYEREGALPGIAFRGVNESYNESTGVVNPAADATYIIGGDVDVDNYILTTRGEGQRTVQTRLKLKSLADTFAQKIIKGDNTSDPREFDGLQARLTGNQLITNSASSGGAALSMKKLDEAIDAVDSPNAIIMNKSMRRNIKAYLRTSSMISEVEDAFGRKLTTYSDLPILVTENGSTEALPFTEANSGGGSSVGSSIYVVSLGVNKLQGIQNGDMQVRNLGEVDDKPVQRLRIEWYAGIALLHGRAAARLYSITDATAGA